MIWWLNGGDELDRKGDWKDWIEGKSIEWKGNESWWMKSKERYEKNGFGCKYVNFAVWMWLWVKEETGIWLLFCCLSMLCHFVV